MRTAIAHDDPTTTLDPMPGISTQTSSSAQRASLQVVQANRQDPLSKCVEDALLVYLKTTDGHAVSGLHRLVIEEVERPLFVTVLHYVDGNLSQAAKLLGLTRSTLRKRLTEYDIDRGR
jgi:Fis family transcriptional regulator